MEHHFYLKSTTKRQIIQAIQINKAWEFGKHFLENEWSLGLKKKKLVCVANDETYAFKQNWIL